MSDHNTSAEQNQNYAEGEPTKEFFLYMLTRDIELQAAILDLIDNSIDGARRLGPDVSLYAIELQIQADQFKIVDNCGGISLNAARTRAFRFGRPPGTAIEPHSIGLYGVGMKRALFKLGRTFDINSFTQNESFRINYSVQRWLAQGDNWHFDFESADATQGVSPDHPGTSILVSDLYEDVSSEISKPLFLASLKKHISRVHRQSLLKGANIIVNGEPCPPAEMKLLVSDDLTPGTFSVRIRDVSIDGIVGLYDDKDPSQAGWYVFCNDRLILDADQSPTTGWGEASFKKIPKFHNQFSRFRGYLYMEATDANKLPWNTMKSGIDTNDAVYRRAKQEMISAMRPVISFLNDLDHEQSMDEQPLHEVVEKSNALDVEEIIEEFSERREVDGTQEIVLTNNNFDGPPPGERVVTTRWIRYQRPVEQVDQLLEHFETNSVKEVGEATFDYYYKLNIR